VFEVASLTPMRLYTASIAFTTELGISPATQVVISQLLIINYLINCKNSKNQVRYNASNEKLI
jgi:hypothetical protein